GFALSSALTFAVYLIGADVVLKRTDSLAGSMWVSGSAAIALAVFAMATGGGQWPVGARQWAPVLASATFTAGAFVCLFAGLRRQVEDVVGPQPPVERGPRGPPVGGAVHPGVGAEAHVHGEGMGRVHGHGEGLLVGGILQHHAPRCPGVGALEHPVQQGPR